MGWVKKANTKKRKLKTWRAKNKSHVRYKKKKLVHKQEKIRVREGLLKFGFLKR